MSDPTAASSGRTAPELAGQVALITGAAHGQGCATALALAREGVHIAALDVGPATRLSRLPHGQFGRTGRGGGGLPCARE